MKLLKGIYNKLIFGGVQVLEQLLRKVSSSLNMLYYTSRDCPNHITILSFVSLQKSMGK